MASGGTGSPGVEVETAFGRDELLGDQEVDDVGAEKADIAETVASMTEGDFVRRSLARRRNRALLS